MKVKNLSENCVSTVVSGVRRLDIVSFVGWYNI